ncbi:MAG: Fe-S cluster assembly protein SufB [Candidatus Kerfeldbacteria bacterium]|nr:Fe-S cluster assembly protein SufB [Candidatus Kerfeldbacteria bacterium]
MSTPTRAQTQALDQLKSYRFGFHEPDASIHTSRPGLSERVVGEISHWKNESDWMRRFRLKALAIFAQKPMPTWGADLSGINFDRIRYYIKPGDKPKANWEDVPAGAKRTFDRLGIPQAEQKWLAGVGAQYDSEVVYHRTKEQLAKRGVIFTDMDTALREHPDIVKQYFGTLIPPADNKFAALNSATWSGGSFVYVPQGVEVELPLQAYFRINSKDFGQFERTLIIAEEGASVHYVEGCTAPVYTTDSLHAAVVEIFVGPRANVRYTTIQNWSKNVYNLVTKRARVHEEGRMEWIDGNLGSKVTMKYPSVYLVGRKAHGQVLSVAFAGAGQHQDAGGKAIHVAPETTSLITSKSISKDGGRTSYRGLLHVAPTAVNAKANVRCDALLLDPASRSDTYPTMRVKQKRVTLGHEASVSKIGEEQLFYLRSRGLSEAEATAMVVAGFIEPIVRTLPLEYAVELNKLIELEMEGSVG